MGTLGRAGDVRDNAHGFYRDDRHALDVAHDGVLAAVVRHVRPDVRAADNLHFAGSLAVSLNLAFDGAHLDFADDIKCLCRGWGRE